MNEFIATIWLDQQRDLDELVQLYARLVGAPAYEHPRRWRWWHWHVCRSCSDARRTFKASKRARGVLGATIQCLLMFPNKVAANDETP